MPRRSESPEGVDDLLEQDAFDDDDLLAGHNDDSLMMEETPRASKAEAANQAAAAPLQVQQQQRNGGSKRVPVPVPAPSGGGSRGRENFDHLEAANGRRSGSGGGGKGGSTRYFIVKSITPYNIDASVKNGIWATQVSRCMDPSLLLPVALLSKETFACLLIAAPTA